MAERRSLLLAWPRSVRRSWTSRRRSLRHDQQGSIHVIEALLAGMIILTAVLFMTNISKPSPPAAESGIDLEGVARDLLVVMENRPATANACPEPPAAQPVGCYPSRLEEIVGHAMGYDVAGDPDLRDISNADAEEFLRQVVPVGNRWLLRLDNGVEPLVLLPASGSNVQLTPRAAKAAETFIVPSWQEHSDLLECGLDLPLPTAVYTPGGPGWGAVPANLEAPTGAVPPAPYGAGQWSQWWSDQVEADTGDPSSDVVPFRAPYGWWHDGSDCWFVGLPDGSGTSYPAYGVQLVVWPIAG